MVDIRLSQLATAPSPAQDTDNLLISRAGVSYKISRKELIKNFLANLADVSIVAPEDGDVLTYDATNGVFSPQHPQAGGLSEVHWDEILDKPSAFPPSTHTHAYSSLTSIPATFTPSAHQHAWVDLTIGIPSTFPPATHQHGWVDLTSGVPSTFPPSTHQHAWNDLISGVPAAFPPSAHRHPWTELDSIPTTFPPSAHTHLWAELTDKPLSFPPSIHNHDDRYYTEQELSTSGSGAQVNWANITGAPSFEGGGDMLMAVYDMDHDGIVDAAASVSWESVTSKPSAFPPSAHAHAWADLTSGVPSTFTPSAHRHPWGDLDSVPATFTPSAHTHDDRYFTETELTTSGGGGSVHWNNVASKPSTFTPAAHQHPGTDVTSAVANANAVPWTGVSGKPLTYPPDAHNHDGVYSPIGHTHTFALEIILGSGSEVVTTGVQGYVVVPWDCTIQYCTLVANASGSISVDVWRGAGVVPTSGSICGSSLPSLASQQTANTTLTGWTVSLSAGDILAFNVTSATTVTQVTMALRGVRA